MEVSGRIHEGSDDLSTGILICDPCKGEDEEQLAVCYCTVCNEFLCGACNKAHRRAKVSKHHKLLDGDSMPKAKLISSEESMCAKHNGKLIEYYCRRHDHCCCCVCATIEHKQCQVEYIDDIASEFEKSKEFTSLMSSIANLTQLLQNKKKISLKKRDDLWRTHLKFVSEVKKFRTEINQILDSLEQRTLMQADNVRDKDSKSTESVSTTCDTILTDLWKMSSTLDNQKESKQQRQLVISAKTSQRQIKQYERLTAEMCNQSTVQDYCFKRNETIIQSINAVKSLGQLNDVTKEAGQLFLEKKVVALEKVSTPNKSVLLQKINALNIQHFTTDTYNCNIKGGIMLDNNMLALADHSNVCLKVVDVNMTKPISCIKCPSNPWDIARVERDQIVAACGKYLVFIKVGEELSIVKNLRVVGNSIGICYTNHQLVVASPAYPPCFRIFDLEGRLLKAISADKIGIKLGCEFKMVLSTDQNTLYVSDWENHSVTSMDLDGNVQHVYKHDKLNLPSGLAIDRQDNIYIATFGSINIHRISPQCKNLNVLHDGPENMIIPPWTVIYCERDNRLYVSHTSLSDKRVSGDPIPHIINVYQL